MIAKIRPVEGYVDGCNINLLVPIVKTQQYPVQLVTTRVGLDYIIGPLSTTPPTTTNCTSAAHAQYAPHGWSQPPLWRVVWSVPD